MYQEMEAPPARASARARDPGSGQPPGKTSGCSLNDPVNNGAPPAELICLPVPRVDRLMQVRVHPLKERRQQRLVMEAYCCQ